jgi:predicted Zn-dependent protease
MFKFLLLFLIFSSLFLSAGIFAISQAQGQNQNSYSLQIQGIAWNKTALKVLIVTPINASWWNPIYVNSTLRAVGQWNDAISFFASNYSDFEYLSEVKLESTVLNKTEAGFDIYINWTQSTLGGTADEVGLASATALNNAILNCTIQLAAHTSHGDALSDGDMQNIAMHELGHGLGLGHSNYTGDLMFPAYTLLGSAESISALDAYGIATVFAWVLNQTRFYPVSEWLQSSPVVSPSNQYKYLPVSPENARPMTLANNPAVQTLVLALEILIHPEILFIVILFITVAIIIALIPKKTTRKPVLKAAS